MNFKSLKASKVIFLFSILTTLFFTFLFLNDCCIKSDFVLIGVVQELFTIPCLLLQPTLLFIVLLKIFKGNHQGKTYLLFSGFILLTTIIATWMSFF